LEGPGVAISHGSEVEDLHQPDSTAARTLSPTLSLGTGRGRRLLRGFELLLRELLTHGGDHGAVERFLGGGLFTAFFGDVFLAIGIERLDLLLKLAALFGLFLDVRLTLGGGHFLELLGKVFLRNVFELYLAVF